MLKSQSSSPEHWSVCAKSWESDVKAQLIIRHTRQTKKGSVFKAQLFVACSQLRRFSPVPPTSASATVLRWTGGRWGWWRLSWCAAPDPLTSTRRRRWATCKPSSPPRRRSRPTSADACGNSLPGWVTKCVFIAVHAGIRGMRTN